MHMVRLCTRHHTQHSETKWYTLPAPVACFHAMNAWESAHDDTTGAATRVDVVLCQYTEMQLDLVSILHTHITHKAITIYSC
jgi:Retinal pigment epithelial membrane protein